LEHGPARGNGIMAKAAGFGKDQYFVSGCFEEAREHGANNGQQKFKPEEMLCFHGGSGG
jgi:hypothetical protein